MINIAIPTNAVRIKDARIPESIFIEDISSLDNQICHSIATINDKFMKEFPNNFHLPVI